MRKRLPFYLLLPLATSAFAQQPDTLAPSRAAVQIPATDSLKLINLGSEFNGFIDKAPGVHITRSTNFSAFLPLQEQLRQVAGVQATPYSGAPGAQVAVRIRGAASLSSNAQPLYVVDGVPVFQNTFKSAVKDQGFSFVPAEVTELDNNPLLSIPTEDIEQVEVLKGAFETAQYGAQGINGVIRITTRRGQAGPPRLRYAGYGGVQRARSRYDLLDAQQYAELANDADRNDGAPPRYSPAQVAAFGRGTDWQRELLRTAAVQEHHLGLEGGTASTRYYIGANYLGQRGVVLNSDLRRYALRANVGQQVGPRLHLALGGSLSETRQHVPFYHVLSDALLMLPTLAAQDAPTQPYSDNPIREAEEYYQTPRQRRLLAQLDAQYRLATGLTLDLRGNLERAALRSDSYTAPLRTSLPGSRTSDLASTYQQWVANPALRYARTSETQRHAVTASLEAIRQWRKSTEQARSFLGGTPPPFFSGNYYLEENTILQFRLAAGYTFAERYQLQGSLRRDGSSTFAPAERWQWLPAAQATWHAGQEAFLRDKQWLNQLDAWVGWGNTSGAGNVGRNYYSILVAGGDNLNQTLRVFVPEPTRQLDVGLTLGAWHQRVSLTVQGYARRTNSDSRFIGTPSSNVRNEGLELSVASRWQVRQLRSRTALAAAANRNRYQWDLPNAPRFVTPYQQRFTGQPLSDFYSPRYLGVDAAGRPRFADDNQQGPATYDDWQSLGSGLPRQLLTLTQQLQYQRLTLDVQADGMFGYRMQNTLLARLDAPSGYDNGTSRLLDRWTPTNPATDVPRASGLLRFPDNSSYALQSGNHARLTAVTLNYKVWERDTRNVSVWLAGYNLLVLSHYRGYDPNVSSAGSDNQQAGLDAGAYPVARTFLMGLRAAL